MTVRVGKFLGLTEGTKMKLILVRQGETALQILSTFVPDY